MDIANLKVTLDAKCYPVMQLFDDLFLASNNTRLLPGDGEPVYLPADDGCDFHRVIFANGFVASCFHEVAHWCIAGEQRRQQVDFGYWYQPDGRTSAQQKSFEQVEIKPQALEWIFSRAANHPFNFSADNLAGSCGPSADFCAAVLAQVHCYCEQGLPFRASEFERALSCHFGVRDTLEMSSYSLL